MNSKEPNPAEMQSGAKHWQVPKQHAAVKSSEEMKQQHRGWNLAAQHRQEPKEQTWQNCESWKKLAAASRKMASHKAAARCKGHIVRKNQTRNNIARGAQKRWTIRRRHQMKSECKSGIKD